MAAGTQRIIDDRRTADLMASGGGNWRLVTDSVMGGISAGRLTAEDIADRVVEGVKADQFYILPHKGILPIIKQRHEDIEELRNPSVEQGL